MASSGASASARPPIMNEAALKAIVAHCRLKTDSFVPVAHDAKIGVLKRWFDISSDELPSIQFSADIEAHLSKLQRIDETALGHWNNELAFLVSDLLLDKNLSLKAEIVDAIGSDKIKAVRATGDSADIILCQAYIFSIIQKMTFNENIEARLLRVIHQYSNDLNLDKLNNLKKEIVKENLCIDPNNPEHLAFWDKQTGKTIFGSPGGEEVTLRDQTYHVPTRIHDLMAIPSSTLPYGEYVAALDRIRTQSLLFSNPFRACGRSEVTSQVYTCDDIEHIKVRQLKK